jgi:hypothetical protein
MPAIIGLQVLPIGWPACGDRATAPLKIFAIAQSRLNFMQLGTQMAVL